MPVRCWIGWPMKTRIPQARLPWQLRRAEITVVFERCQPSSSYRYNRNPKCLRLSGRFSGPTDDTSDGHCLTSPCEHFKRILDATCGTTCDWHNLVQDFRFGNCATPFVSRQRTCQERRPSEEFAGSVVPSPAERRYRKLGIWVKSHIPRRRTGSTGRCNTLEHIDLTALPIENRSVRSDSIKT